MFKHHAYPWFIMIGFYVWGVVIYNRIIGPRRLHVHKIKNPRVLITGVGRSGSTAVNKAFQTASFKSKLEQHDKEVSVGWPFARYQEYPIKDGFNNQWHNYNNRHKDELFDIVIHLVRHPLDTIASWTTMSKNPSVDYVIHITPEIDKSMHKLQISMIHWYNWNSIVEKYADRLWNIETLDIKSECFDLWENDDRCSQIHLTPKVNSRQHLKYSWNDLSSIDENLTIKIQTMCKRFGYHNCSI